MSRAQRLLDLIQILRRHRFPVTGENLAAELKISLRTLYRDIKALQEQGPTLRANQAWDMCCNRALLFLL